MNKLLIVDIYALSVDKKSLNKIPKKFKDYEKIFNYREALLALASGEYDTVAIPMEKLPGYDFSEFAMQLFDNGILETIEVETYSMS